MSIGRKIELAVALLIMLTIAGLYGYGKWEHRGKATAEQHYAVSNGDAEAYKTVAAGTKRIAKQEQRVHEELDQALEANPVWADEPVPSDVAVLLCHDPHAACRANAEAGDHGAGTGSDDQWADGEAGN